MPKDYCQKRYWLCEIEYRIYYRMHSFQENFIVRNGENIQKLLLYTVFSKTNPYFCLTFIPRVLSIKKTFVTDKTWWGLFHWYQILAVSTVKKLTIQGNSSCIWVRGIIASKGYGIQGNSRKSRNSKVSVMITSSC